MIYSFPIEKNRTKKDKAPLQVKKNDSRFSHGPQRSFKEKSSASPFPSFPWSNSHEELLPYVDQIYV